jgi:hypothetical protein
VFFGALAGRGKRETDFIRVAVHEISLKIDMDETTVPG